MAQEPDRLKQDIENTRASLTRDVDRLADKTSPTRVAQRRWTSAKEKVMGSSEHARHAARDTTSSAVSTVHDKAGDAVEAARDAPAAVAAQTKGNPVAAGIIAFGVGMLAATLIPVTDVERRAGQQLKDHGGDLTDRAKDMATDLKDDLTDTVQDAAGHLRDTARDAARTTTDEAQSSARDVKEQTRQAARNAY